MTLPLYRRLLGAAFDRLPPRVRALHDIQGRSVWHGRVDVERGTALICRLIAKIGRLPPVGKDQPLTVTFTPQDGAELWHRAFGTRVFASRQSLGRGTIHERVGPARLTLVPSVSSDGLNMSLAALHVLGIPIPRALLPKVATRERDADRRYHFEVDVHVPVLGRLIRYEGWLEPVRNGG